MPSAAGALLTPDFALAKAGKAAVSGFPNVKVELDWKGIHFLQKNPQSSVNREFAQVAAAITRETKKNLTGRTIALSGQTVNKRTGRLHASIHTRTVSENGGPAWEVYSDVPYADYLEYGTSKITARKYAEDAVQRVLKDRGLAG